MALGVFTIVAVWLGAAGAQGQGQTTHDSALPQITTGGQADWSQHNFDVQGGRYSPLDAINTANVGRLALSWAFEAGAGNSITQVTPLVVDGVMYLNAGSTLFAVNAITGETVWTLELDSEPVGAGAVVRPMATGGSMPLVARRCMRRM